MEPPRRPRASPTRRPTHRHPRRCVRDTPSAGCRIPPAPRHPLGRHGHLRPAGRSRCARWSARGCRTARCCSGTRRTARTRGWSSSTCWAWACSRAAARVRVRARSTRARARPARLPAGGRAVYDLLSAADTVGVFQVESPRADGHPAAPAAADVLRHRHRGRAHPARSHPGRLGAPVHRARARPRAGHLPAPAAGDVAGQDQGRAAVPGAAHADGHRRRRLHAGGGRPAAPRDGLEAVDRADGGDARTATPAWPGTGSTRRRGRGDLREAPGVRGLRVPASRTRTRSRSWSTPARG